MTKNSNLRNSNRTTLQKIPLDLTLKSTDPILEHQWIHSLYQPHSLQTLTPRTKGGKRGKGKSWFSPFSRELDSFLSSFNLFCILSSLLLHGPFPSAFTTLCGRLRREISCHSISEFSFFCLISPLFLHSTFSSSRSSDASDRVLATNEEKTRAKTIAKTRHVAKEFNSSLDFHHFTSFR